MRRFWNKTSVRIVFYVILLVLPLNLWSFYSVSRVRNDLLSESRNSIAGTCWLTMHELDKRMSAVDRYLLSTLPQENSYYQEVQMYPSEDRYYHAIYNLVRTLQTQTGNSLGADGFLVYDIRSGYEGAAGLTGKDLTVWQHYLKDEQAESYKASRLWESVVMDESVWLVRVVRKGNVFFAALIHAEQDTQISLQGIPYRTAMIELQDPDQLQADSQQEEVQNSFISAKMSEKYEDAVPLISVTAPSEKAKVCLVVSVNQDEILHSIPWIQRSAYHISLLFFLVVPLLVWLIHRYLLNPMRVLHRAMSEVENGTSQYQILERAKTTEFAELYAHFNQMILTQDRLGKELIDKETFGKRMELQNLQLQIRPHFLLNSFNLLYGLVTAGKTDSAQKMILYLSDYFRYIFRSDKELETYGNELKLIREYIGVARYRHPFISFEETHDKDVLCVPVPPLLIHNFIENVIKHALNPEGMTEIELTASYKDGKAVFMIEDDGRGMDAKLCSELSRPPEQNIIDAGKHVGIKNSWRRLQFFFGSTANILVTSQPGTGTLITLEYDCTPLERGDGI